MVHNCQTGLEEMSIKVTASTPNKLIVKILNAASYAK